MSGCNIHPAGSGECARCVRNELEGAVEKLRTENRKLIDASYQTDPEESLTRHLGFVTAAGFSVAQLWQLANRYWPASARYNSVREPWWLFQTEIGLVEIGHRKRVYGIDWSHTEVRGLVTEDVVTLAPHMVHASSGEKVVDYLKRLRELAVEQGRLA